MGYCGAGGADYVLADLPVLDSIQRMAALEELDYPDLPEILALKSLRVCGSLHR